jgi:hypothetical protein
MPRVSSVTPHCKLRSHSDQAKTDWCTSQHSLRFFHLYQPPYSLPTSRRCVKHCPLSATNVFVLFPRGSLLT